MSPKTQPGLRADSEAPRSLPRGPHPLNARMTPIAAWRPAIGLFPLQPPDVSAWVRPGRRSVTGVPLIQRSCTMSGGFELIEQLIPRAVGNPLPGRKLEFVGATLYVAPIDVRRLIVDVQHKPKLDARIGHRNLDATLPCVVYGSRYVRMLVDVEHAPDLVEVLIAAPGSAPSSHVLRGMVDEGFGRHPACGQTEANAVPVVARPCGQVAGLRDLTLSENANDTPLPPWSMAAPGPSTGRWRHESVASIACRNSAGSSTGTPP